MAQYTVEVGPSATGPWTQIAAGTFDVDASLQAQPGRRDGERSGLRPAHADDDAVARRLVHRRVGVLRLRRAARARAGDHDRHGAGRASSPIRRPTFTFSSDQPGGSFRCRLDGEPFAPCPSPYTTAPLTNGQTYTFEVYAVNQYGTADATPETRTFTINSELPTTTLGDQAGGGHRRRVGARSRSPATAARSSAAGTGPPSRPAPRRQDWTVAEGEHTFAVRAVNSLGPDPSPETHTFTVDRTAPVDDGHELGHVGRRDGRVQLRRRDGGHLRVHVPRADRAVHVAGDLLRAPRR